MRKSTWNLKQQQLLQNITQSTLNIHLIDIFTSSNMHSTVQFVKQLFTANAVLKIRKIHSCISIQKKI